MKKVIMLGNRRINGVMRVLCFFVMVERFLMRLEMFLMGKVMVNREMNIIGVRKKMELKGLEVVGLWRRRIWVRV